MDTSAQRRTLTVMFCDIIDFTTLSTRLDPEDLNGVIRGYQIRVAATIERHNGFIARYVGDGVLIYFGWPEAHEADAERAVRAGLEVIETIAQDPSLSGLLRLRIGIATGLVVIGEPIGTGEARQLTAIGEPPNMAARLQGLAAPNSVVIDAATQRQIGGLFSCRELGLVTLKGIPEPASAWEVIEQATVESRFEALHAGAMTPLVGRRPELAVLLRRWRRAMSGSGQVVLLSGEAGIGKSRTTSMLLNRMAHQPHIRLRYFCSPHQQDSPLGPFIRQMERALDLRQEDTASEKVSKLETALPPDIRHAEAVALLAELLSIPPTGAYTPLGLTPQQRRENTLNVLIRQLTLLSQEGPVMATFEDVHWIDPTSAELLDRVVQQIDRLRVLLVITFRPEVQPRWVSGPSLTRLVLGPFNRQQAMSMIDQVACAATLPRAVREDILARADGVPLFLEELTKATIERGDPPASRGFTDDPAWRNFEVPTSLHASLMARLDHLGPAKEVAQIGAAIGREFSLKLLASVARKKPSDLYPALRRLTDAGLVFRQSTPGNATFLFKHALVLDTAYSTLLRSTRRQLHGRIVESLEELFPDTAVARPELLAYHCTAARLHWKGAGYWLAAGQQALARSAMLEAVAHLQKGLDVVAQVARSPERDRCELELQIALGKAPIATKGHAAQVTGETFTRARELCDHLGQPAQTASVLHGQWTHALLRGDLPSARRRADELLRLGETRREPVWRVMGYRCFGVTCFPLGEFQHVCDTLGRGLAMFDPGNRAEFGRWTVDDVQVVMMYYSSWALLYLGHVDQARQRCDSALALARELGQPYTLAHALIARTLLELILQHYDNAQPLIGEVLALANTHNISYFNVVGSLFNGRCMAEMSEKDEAIEVLTRNLELYRRGGSLLVHADVHYLSG